MPIHIEIRIAYVSIVLWRQCVNSIETCCSRPGGWAQAVGSFSAHYLPTRSSQYPPGAFLAFIISFDELVVTMFLAGTEPTLPKKTFDDMLNQIEPTIAAVSVLQIAMVCVLLGVSFVCRTEVSGRIKIGKA
ncbi:MULTISPECIES: ABC transporter permease subunit [unclassified Rhizobium]|uniref:hypothetical protein n=1 Tax=unclassified Rhizobium TaxID=2613769 RepID=UPI001ADB7B17|nr:MULTISPECIES: hypothetical protein [unclassified Rhizobium]MBO9126933.1 hypothetical protein [Rhizobium sp. 16-488-2b]MBO9177381.1 hypothetical protein [Rhizobium sp. 16-488-2a]